MSKITIALAGKHVPLELLARVLSQTNTLLKELTESLDLSEPSWEVVGLKLGSAHVSVSPKSEQEKDAAPVLAAFRLGFQGLETKADRPRGYSDAALETIKEISRIGADSGHTLTYRIEDGDQVETFPVGQRVAQNAQAVLSQKPKRTYLGSVEGVVELMSGLQEYFAVVDRISGRKIRCNCGKDMLAEIAAHAWEKNIRVTGEVTADPFGRPQAIAVRRYQLFKDPASLPTPEDMIGLYNRG